MTITLGLERAAGLADALRGDVLRPGDRGYDEARRVWNGSIDRHPAVIVQAEDPIDVAAAVRYAVANDLRISVRGGGHSPAGHSVVDDGLMIDLRRMKGVEVNPEARIVRVQPGVLLGELDAATQEHGLAVPAGTVSHTGVAGLTLGGGIGFLMRKHGLTIDNLLEVELVTADGEIVRANDFENEDLFWGVRGGGGNFGIVTEFAFRAHPVGAIVQAGTVLYRLEDAADVMKMNRDFVENGPDELTLYNLLLTVPPAPPFPPELHGEKVLMVNWVYAGPVEEAELVTRPLRWYGRPAADLTANLPYTVVQSRTDAAVPHGRSYYMKADFFDLTDEAIETILDEFALSTIAAEIHVAQLGGAVARVPAEATAFGHRHGGHMVWGTAGWDSGDGAAQSGWINGVLAALGEWSIGGGYGNVSAADDPRTAYAPASWERLVDVKTVWDPDNVFSLNQNVPPRT
jgi:FAD/FMN-containing dehydrogenase